MGETGLPILSMWRQFSFDVTRTTWVLCNTGYMMTSSNGNIFRVTGPLCGEFTGPGKFPTQRPVTRSFDVFFDLRLNKRLSKQSWGWWSETPSSSLWRHRNDPSATQLKLKSREISFVHNIGVPIQSSGNIAQSTAVSLPCSVQNFKTIGQLRQML